MAGYTLEELNRLYGQGGFEIVDESTPITDPGEGLTYEEVMAMGGQIVPSDIQSPQIAPTEPIYKVGGKGASTGKRILATVGDIAGQRNLGQVIGRGLAKKGVNREIAGMTQRTQGELIRAQQALSTAQMSQDPTAIARAQRAVDIAQTNLSAVPTQEQLLGPKKTSLQVAGAIGESLLGLATGGAGGLAKGIATQGAKRGIAVAGRGGLQSAPNLIRSVGQSIKAGRVGQAIGRSAATAVPTGAGFGLAQGLQEEGATVGSVAGSTALGAGAGLAGSIAIPLAGAATKGAVNTATRVLGKAGLKTDRLARLQADDAIKAITPTARELPKKAYEKAQREGLVRPGGFLKREKFTLSKPQREAVIKHADVISTDATRTRINVAKKMERLDDEVGQYLRQNNGIFNKAQLRTAISNKLKPITDLTVSEENLNKAKNKIIDNFVDALEKNDMESLWQARKEFDQQIQNAFSGSPTLQKKVQTDFRNAIQDFISEKTDNVTYKGKMKDMSDLFTVDNLARIKSSGQKGRSKIERWLVKNPRAAKAIGGVILTGAGTLGLTKAAQALGVGGGSN